MSLLSRAAMFALKEIAKPALENVGKHLGDAVGTVIGRKIQPDHEACDCDERDGDGWDNGPGPGPDDGEPEPDEGDDGNTPPLSRVP